MDPTAALAALASAVREQWWDLSVDLGEGLREIYRANGDLAMLSDVTESLVVAHLANVAPERAFSASLQAARDLRGADQYRPQALAWARRAADVAQRSGLILKAIEGLRVASNVAQESGDVSSAVRIAREAVTMTIGMPSQVGIVPLGNLGALLVAESDFRGALAVLDDAVRRSEVCGDKSVRASVQFDFAVVNERMGNSEVAYTAFGVAATLYNETGDVVNAAVSSERQSDCAAPRSEAAHNALSAALGYWRRSGRQELLAACLIDVAALQFVSGQGVAAAETVREALACEVTVHRELSYEIAVRDAALRAQSNTRFVLPRNEPPVVHPMVTAAVRALSSGQFSNSAVRVLLCHGALHSPKIGKLWLFERLVDGTIPAALE